jgi:dipeptidyl aminopeptidase/acylaminoacyl peptidase
MSILQRSIHIGLLSIILLAPMGRAEKKPDLPSSVESLIEVLFGAPEFQQAKLSPDGAHLAFLREEKGVKVLNSYAFKTHRTYQLAGASGVNHIDSSGYDQNISNFDWLGADQLIVFADEGAVYYSGLWVTNATLKQNEKLSTHDKLLFMRDALPQNPTTALLSESSHEDFYSPLWCLDKKSLMTYERERNPGRVVGWRTDPSGAVRLAVMSEPNSHWSYLYRDAEKAPWRSLALPPKTVVLSFDGPGKNLLVALPGDGGRYQVRGFNLEKSALDTRGIADPAYDVIPNVAVDPRSGMPVALQYDADKPKCVWLLQQYADLSRVIEGAFPGHVVASIGVLDDQDYIFSTYSDTAPLAYYRYNVGKQEIRPVIVSRPEAAKMKWAPMAPITFAAHDGYPLHGYLTLPLGQHEGRKVPLVVLSHGGPQLRDTWGFDEEVQFLAALGYGVLQVNYRGSSGFGPAHELVNTIEVAEKSVDDVTDGIRWAIAQGYANPKKIVAYGASYGGYISLAIATRYPDLPAAAVGYAGVYDWEAQYKEDTNRWLGSNVSPELFRWRADYYLDVRQHADRYHAVSPVNFAAKVLCPVMLFHGSLDQRVSLSQTRAMTKALSGAGKTVEMIKDSEAVHGLANEKQSKAFYRSLAAFLLRNVPPESSERN